MKRIKDNLSKIFDKYDYNFKYKFIWIKFHSKKNVQLQNFNDEI